MQISISENAEGRRILAGGALGRKLLTALIGTVSSETEPQPLFLDFTDIDIATSSFLREGVIGFRDYARGSLKNVYPVVANAVSAVVEEFDFFLHQRSDAFWCCDLDTESAVKNVRLLGELDPGQRSTFESVRTLGSATAPELAQKFADGRIGPTAWNNRLSTLAAKGVLVERRSGRSKSFSSLLEVA